MSIGRNKYINHLKVVVKRMGVTTLDYLLITHPHNDHIGGAFSDSSNFLRRRRSSPCKPH